MFDAPTMKIIPSPRVVSVHLFRHGETEQGATRLCRGHADVPLSAKGLAQSQQAAAWFLRQHPRPDVVFSSDLSRCTALAQAITPDFRPTPLLREQSMGRWESRSWEELTIADPAGVTAYWDDYTTARPPEGESYNDLAARVVGWWEAEAPREGRVVLVTHIGVIRALVCHWLGLRTDQALRWAPRYASCSEVLLAEAGAVISSFGVDAYLHGPG